MVFLKWCAGLLLISFTYLSDLQAEPYSCTFTMTEYGEIDKISFTSRLKSRIKKQSAHVLVLADTPYYSVDQNDFLHEFYTLKYSGIFTRLVGNNHDYWYILQNYTIFVMLTPDKQVEKVGYVRWQEPISAENPIQYCSFNQ